MRTFFVANPDQKLLLIQNLLLSVHSYSSPHSLWTSSWLDWQSLFVKLHTDTFLSAKFDNDMSTVFVDNPDQKLFLFQKLLGCIHSYASPHFIWTNSWLDWRILFVNLHTETFIRAKFDNDIRADNPDQKIFLFQKLLGGEHSNSSPHFIWTNSWLDWKILFVKLHTETFFERKIWQRHENFFRSQPRSKILSDSKLLVSIHSYSSPHFVWTSSWLDWKLLFLKLHTDTFLSAKFDNDMSTVFVDNPDQKFLLFQKLLGCIHSYASPHFIWTNSWLDWRILFVNLHTETFIRAKFDNDIRADNPDQKIFLFQKLLGGEHSNSSPHFIWTNSWLDWKILFVKLHTETFFERKIWQRHENFFRSQPRSKILSDSKLLVSIHSYSSPHFVWTSSWLDWKLLFLKLHTDTFLSAKFDNDMSTVFVDNPDQKFLLFQKLLGCIHSYSSPHFIWTNSWLDWRILFVKLHTETFIRAKFDNDIRADNPDQKIFLFQKLLGGEHSNSSPHFIWTNSWLDWKILFVKLHTETFIRAKFDNDMSTFFVDNPDQTHFLLQNLTVCIHFYSSPHSIWTSPWIDRKTLFVKLHSDTFWAQSLTTTWVLFSLTTQINFFSVSEPNSLDTLLL